jgi:hypothetical protein
MALFPTKQTITVTRSTGTLDIYGKKTGVSVSTLKCRTQEGTHITVNRTAGAEGSTIVCDLKIMLDKLADITYDDYITYTNEAGTVYHARPKNIKIQRDFAGKPLLTEVML